MKVRSRYYFCLVFFCLSVVFASGGSWPRFRGPDGAGQADDTPLPSLWTGVDYVWRVRLPGFGHSSPVVWEGQVFVTSALQADGTRTIQSLRASDGSLLWEVRFQSTPYDLGRSTSYDTASPTVDENRVYMTWTSGSGYFVVALDRRNGDEVWRRKLGSFEGEHGSGSSPIGVGALLIVPNDQSGASSIIALDCATGVTKWSVDRRSVKTAYSTPIIYRPSGRPAEMILASTAHGVSSFDPITGRFNWELPEVFGTIRVVGSPVVAGDLIFAQCGSGGGGKRMVAIRPPNPLTETNAEVAYEVRGSLPYVPTPVAYGKWLFLWGDSGIVSCLDTDTGTRVWRERVGGEYFGSPVRVKDRIYCISREGEVVVLSAKPQYELLGRVDLEEPSYSTPAVADGVMFLRTFSQLMAIRGR